MYFADPIDIFALPIKKKYESGMVLILIRAILEQSINNKMVSKI